MQLTQLQLKISQGGFGLASAERSSHSAFIGSWAASLAELPSRVTSLRPGVSVIDLASTDIFDGHLKRSLDFLHTNHHCIRGIAPSVTGLHSHPSKLQARLSSIQQEDHLESYLKSLDLRSRARVRSCGGAEAGLWLDAVPSTPQFSLGNAEFQIATFLRLGAEIPALRQLSHCGVKCKKPVDPEGYHTITCTYDGGAIHRHDRILHTWYLMLKSAGFHCEKEKEEMFIDKKRPDIAVYDFEGGQKLILDISVAHPWNAAIMSKAASTSGFAATERDKDKFKKYLLPSTQLGYLFKPVVCEVLGRWSPTASALFRSVCRRGSDALPIPSDFSHYWKRRLSICLQTSNVDIIQTKIKSSISSGAKMRMSAYAEARFRCFGEGFA